MPGFLSMSEDMFSKNKLFDRSEPTNFSSVEFESNLRFHQDAGMQGSEVNSPEHDLSSWDSLNDPREHSPQEFRYLVHAINPLARSSMSIVYLTSVANGGYESDPEILKRMQINMSAEPERVSERPLLSMSLVDQDHPATWGPAGLILKVPAKNIVITSPQDFGSLNFDMKTTLERGASVPKYSVDSLLTLSSPYDYNEVVAQGCASDGARIELAGFFIKKTPGGKMVNAYLANTFKGHARRLGLPIVEIEDKAFVKDGIQLDKNTGSLDVISRGVRYVITSTNSAYDFYAFDGDTRSFMTPEEVSEVRGILEAASPEDRGTITLEEFDEKYWKAIHKRESPSIKRDENGSLQSISWKQGYGSYATTYRISQKSFYVVNDQEESACIQEGMTGGSLFESDRTPYSYKPAEAALQSVRSAHSLTDEEKSEILTWLDEEAIDRLYQAEVRRSDFEDSIREISLKYFKGRN